ncbi:MAG TPA: PAS domain S-box protein [bacterium]|nr:PAS domain S-box protein [bacterium]
MCPKPTYQELLDRIDALEKLQIQRKSMEEKLRTSESRLHAVIESLPFDFFMISPEGRYVMVNSVSREHWGDLVGKRPEEVAPDKQTRKLWLQNNKRALSGDTVRGEVELSPRGEPGYYYNILSPIYSENEILGIVGVNIDITDWTKQEEAVRKSEHRYRALVEDMPAFICRFLPEGTLTFVNTYYCNYFQMDREELIGKNFFQFIPKNYREWVREQFLSLTQGSPTITYQHQVYDNEGNVVWQEWTDRALFDEEGNVTEYQSIGRDITEQRRAEEALSESAARLRRAQQMAMVGDWELNVISGDITLSDELCQILGIEPAEETSIDEFLQIVHPDDRQQVRDAVNMAHSEGKSADVEIRLVRSGDEERVLRLQFGAAFSSEKQPQRIIGVAQDITERKKLEEQFYQAQKMEAIGTLAGGIAHDFNNLLMGILGSASLMQMELDADHPRYERLQKIEELVRRGASLTNQLLGFAQRGKYEAKPTNLNTLVRECCEMFGRTRKEITIRTSLQSEVWPVEADHSQIEQMLLNLYVNAWQAMPEGGALTVETKNVTLEGEFVRTFEANPGRYVMISVTDTGVGMDREIQEKIFDPFFTTKEVGKGTGLGLSSVYGIIENHNGFIDVLTKKGEGSTFRIYLPAVDQPVRMQERQTVQDEIPEQALHGDERILVVDDEPMITTIAREMLEEKGYHLGVANSGQEALTMLSGTPEEPAFHPDLIVLDLIMPEADGGEIIHRIQEMCPQVKVLLSSGYSMDSQAIELLARGCDGFIQKPFDAKELLYKVRTILDKK